MLSCLWLGAVDVSSHKQQGRVHDSSAGQHCWQEDLMARTITERNVSQKLQGFSTVFISAFWGVLLFRGKGLVTFRFWTFWTFVNFWVSITQSDSDVSNSFLSEPDSIDRWNGPNHGWLTVSDVSHCTDVQSSLSTDNLWRKRMKCINVLIRLVLQILVMRHELLDLLFS